jgi:hypothetical protein
MNTTIKHRPILPLVILSLCLLFVGTSAFVGGYLMLRDPYGAPMGMPVSLLERTPFQNFLAPGFLLLVIWAASFLVLVGLWMRPQWGWLVWLTEWSHEHWAWALSITLGLALVIWLLVQVATLPAVAPIQYVMFVLAALLVLVPFAPAMREYYQLE